MDTVLFFHTSLREAWRKELAGAYRHARARGWRVQVVEPPEGGGAPPVRELLKFWKPAGCIAECSGKGGEKLRPALFGRIPTVFLGSDPAALPPDASCVSPAPEGVGGRAAREFLEAGLENFAFVAADGNRFWSRDREADFARALALHGRRCEVFGRGGRFRDATARAMALSVWLKALPKPCGLLAENDYAAAEVLDLARRARVRVPEALAVIGVDNDTALCENSRPALTSIALDFERAGYRASEILDSLVRGGGGGGAAAKPVRETYPTLGVARRGSTPSGLGVPPRIQKALAFIREKACEGIAASDVAALLPGSRRKAEIEFRRFTGHGIFEEIQRVRFEMAELLLRDRYRAIGAIAGLCGWRSENALRAAFLKRHGVSMRKWRKRQGSLNPAGEV
ncbi:MAG: substrate-binding domain-containing protein [Kiritimatiellae bacterium]|nr:substrate-binding domain-containing protein [Kiritimatiellia bacterium]